ncbi:MAG: efflux RND transporter periplasmic adaptor subunit [Elusimicrobia bacterium]|nr:efflux RND transporter periplasmic adaptor subunit [Elusimicrobiota bacterium]
MKKILTLLILLLVGTGIYFFISGPTSQNQDNLASKVEKPAERQLSVRSREPEIGEMKILRHFTGEVSAVNQANVYAEAPGRLRKYAFEEGDEVKENDVLAFLDREITGMKFEPMSIRSPIKGVISRLYPGIGDTLTPQQALATVANLNRMKVSFNIPEKDLEYVSRGNLAKLKVSARPGVILEGEVVRISHSLDSLSRTAYAEAHFDNPNRVILPGMFADLEVTVKIIQDTLLVPIDAAIRSHDESEMHVFINDNGIARRKQVVTGYSASGKTQIIEGLSPEEKVIVEGQYFVKDGDPVREAK